MRSWLLAAALAGCYAPTAHPGIACGADGACPSGQHCLSDNTCGVEDPGEPPETDGGLQSARDRDGDTVDNDADNCPDVANADQGDEDADGIGDPCDPCPIDASAADADGDGVGDTCDPDPDKPGNAMVLFEGFHSGVPATWQVFGAATQQGDDVELVAQPMQSAALVPTTIGPVMHGRITAQITVTATVGANDAGIGVATEFSTVSNAGVSCELYADKASDPTMRVLSLYDYKADNEIAFNNYVWASDTPIRVSSTRSDAAYSCSAGGATVGGNGTPQGMDAAHPAIESFSSTARISWVMIISR